jgi:hypothetical protein
VELSRLDPGQLSCADVLPDADVEVDTRLVAGALVERQGDHFRIASGFETPEELETLERRSRGDCECGWLLSQAQNQWFCRRCDRGLA